MGAGFVICRQVGGRSARHETYCSEPCHGGYQRNVVKTPGVVVMIVDCHTREDGARAVKCRRFEKLPVDGVPGPVAALPNQAQSYNQNDLFACVKHLEAATVN